MDKQGFVYFLMNPGNTVIYTGVTSDLKKRTWEHKMKLVKGFAEKYNLTKLVYYETSPSIISAIEREKQVKAGSRKKKLYLITKRNPEFLDLYDML